MDYYRLLTEEKERLSAQTEKYLKAIADFPEGTLTVNKNGDYCKYYFLKDSKRHYIPQNENQLIEELAKKKYLLAKVKDARAEINAIDLYLKHHKDKSLAEQLLKKGDGVAEVLEPLIVPQDEKLREWAEAEYPAYQGFPQYLVHEGPFGKMYRSKTEANIAFLLVKNSIASRYEWERNINGSPYAIDFTTRHPVTGKFIFWEHFGRMDDPSYCMKIGPKLHDFAADGIIPDKNLIMTFESKQHPVNISQLEEIVRRWYL